MQLNLPSVGIAMDLRFDYQHILPYIDPHTRSYKGEEKGEK